MLPPIGYVIVSVTVSYGSLVSFLDSQQAARETSTPVEQPRGLCLLAGGIVGRNLEAELARQEIPTAGLAVSTIEDTATELLDAAHRRTDGSESVESVDILDQQLCEQLVVDTITSTPGDGSLAAVDELLSGFDWAGRPTLRETLWSELDRYFRMTDAGADHQAAVDVATDLEASNPYAGARSTQALTAFRELHGALEQRTAALPESTYLSRSHLVSAAREQLDAEWAACYPNVEWVAVDTVSVLDNPTLRFFETLATLDDGPELYVFGAEAGAGPTVFDRLSGTGLDPAEAVADEPDDGTVDQPHVRTLMDTIEGTPPDSVPNVEFVEAPDGRRELDYVAGQIRQLTTGCVDDSEGSDDTAATDSAAGESATPSCGEIVIAAKDVIPYRSRIRDVFTTHSIPVHIEARQPLMQTGPYRYLTAVFELLAAVAADEPVTTQELVDPLRLGFRPPETPADGSNLAAQRSPAAETSEPTVDWPMDGPVVSEIEARLGQLGPSDPQEGRPFADWVDAVGSAFEPAEWPAIHAFVDWVADTAAQPPESGTAVDEVIESLLNAYLVPLTAKKVRQPSGPGIDGTRTALTAKHDSHVVDRLRAAASRGDTYVDRATAAGLGEPGWQQAAEAVTTVCGSSSYWSKNADGNAVRVINAANAPYVDAEHVFVIGVAAEEFPVERSPPTFFHEAFYEAIRETARAADRTAASYLHAPTNQAQFEQDIDEYRAAVAAATEGVWLCRQYRSADGESLAWSGFVDAYTSQASEEVHRIAMDDWLPATRADESRTTAIKTAPPRDRLRLLCATVPDGISSSTAIRRLSGQPLDTAAAIQTLLSQVDGDAYLHDIEPRRRRYHGSDTQSITVRPAKSMRSDDSPRQSDGTLLADRAGPPTRLHELDLYSNCQLKYYFYQYVDGGGVDRDQRATLPPPIGERYPASAVSAGVRRLIQSTDRLADRQAAFGQFDSLGAFRDQLISWIETDPALTRAIVQPMLGEYRAVEQERAAEISREWRWEPAQTVRIDGQPVRVPGHRVDRLADSGVAIPVWYTGEEGAARRLVSRSVESTTAVTARDHRLLVGAETIDRFAGALVYDPTSAAAVAPHGIVVGDALNPIPKAVPDSSNLTQHSRSTWEDRRSKWHESATAALGAMTAAAEPLTYEASESFVEAGGCRGCAYRELCGLPARREAQQ